MKIEIILPYKEIFSEKKASAVSITVKNSMKFSKYKKNILVYGQDTVNPFYKKNFVGIKTNKLLHFGNNLSIIKNFIKLTKKNKSKSLIEIHNRPYLFNYLVKYKSNNPIIIYYHNNPLDMKGSKTVAERKKIINNAAGIIFVSHYLKKQFLSGINYKPKNIHVLPNGIEKNITKIPKKQKIVMFVGRLVEEKGAHIFVEAIENLLKQFPNWKFYIIGASKAGQTKLNSTYEKKLINLFLNYGAQANYLGFISNAEVKKFMKASSILVVPSVWDEPFGLTAIEGLASAQAVIGSANGGLKEILKDSGILINNINSKKLESKLKMLMNNNLKLLDYQNKALKNFKYDQKNISFKQDLLREKIFNNFINK